MTHHTTATQVAGIAKSYGHHAVLSGIDPSVPTGTVYALLGPNGAGKTTMVRILSRPGRSQCHTPAAAGVFMSTHRRQETVMTSDTRIPATEITGMYGGLIKIAMRKLLGGVPKGAGVLWHHPTVFKDMMKFGARVEKWTVLDRNLASLATMAAAAEIGCSACLDFGYFMSHNKGLDEVKVREVPRWRESELFTPLERRVMDYAEAICQTPPVVTDEMSAALLDELGAPALVELTAKVGTMNLSARTNVALGIRSEHYAEACGLPPLAAPAAISAQPVVSTR